MTFCCANQIKDACNSKYIEYLSCKCGDGRGIFWASEFLSNPPSMVLYLWSGQTSLRLMDKVNRYAKRRHCGRTSKSQHSLCRVISFWNFLAWSRPFSH